MRKGKCISVVDAHQRRITYLPPTCTSAPAARGRALFLNALQDGAQDLAEVLVEAGVIHHRDAQSRGAAVSAGGADGAAGSA